MQQLVRKSVLWQLVLAICLLTTSAGCKDDKVNPYDNFDAVAQAEKEDKAIKAYLEGFLNLTPADYTRTASGLYYVVKTPGTGEKPVKGQQVEMHYVGKFVSDGQKFDSSYDRAQTFKFTLGQGRVIKGWEEGVLLMSRGEKAQLIIPSQLGYGRYGYGAVPGNTPIMFDVELIDF
ncbi:FKBP-type peptidyl-prolyl cis-trans isomerase [Nibribacter ruber]|uniref:Peptidyl-prolyl cis-trans isomerase n=1 Tax=Nibribacter ruber TaxID=2698458 RepID=A0A6P1P2J5_9BACT|nr:FKBP-type peptidyl-prolyl cis-trans isomerase [Nibribacter ruber]QHL88627.1 FKBP-type peptidyl-prolyl cis-trans isomerase [Nibribacter ruber]